MPVTVILPSTAYILWTRWRDEYNNARNEWIPCKTIRGRNQRLSRVSHVSWMQIKIEHNIIMYSTRSICPSGYSYISSFLLSRFYIFHHQCWWNQQTFVHCFLKAPVCVTALRRNPICILQISDSDAAIHRLWIWPTKRRWIRNLFSPVCFAELRYRSSLSVKVFSPVIQ